jgi:hypothetical protein
MFKRKIRKCPDTSTKSTYNCAYNIHEISFARITSKPIHAMDSSTDTARVFVNLRWISSLAKFLLVYIQIKNK